MIVETVFVGVGTYLFHEMYVSTQVRKRYSQSIRRLERLKTLTNESDVWEDMYRGMVMFSQERPDLFEPVEIPPTLMFRQDRNEYKNEVRRKVTNETNDEPKRGIRVSVKGRTKQA